MRTLALLCTIALTLVTLSQPQMPGQQQRSVVRRPEAIRRLNAGLDALQANYVAQAGLYRTTGWWNSANALTTLVDALRIGAGRTHESVIANTFTNAQVTSAGGQQAGAGDKMTGFPGFLNKYYDDEGWWALAWIDAYDLTAKPEYLAMATSIFRDMSGGWDDTCGGGIWWSKDRTYKNAIANALFFDVAASLARRGDGSATEWATKEWAWFRSSGMINADHLVNDGLSIDKVDRTCRNNGRTVWTYNQGVLLGALTEWSRAKNDGSLLIEARILADAGLSHLADGDGILHDPCEPTCGADANQFKGIFMRNLRLLHQQSPDARYSSFFAANAASLWDRDRTAANEFGVVWTGPVVEVTAGAQSSALDALVAAAGER